MCDKIERRVIKISTVSGEVPAIGPSADHRDGSWLPYHIYSGEYFLNETDGRLWIGAGSAVKEITLENGGVRIYRATLTQSGSTSGDVPIPGWEDNRLGDTVSYVRNNAGDYDLVCASEAFEIEANTFILIGSARSLSHQIIAYWEDGFTIKIKTGSPGAADGILTNTAIYILSFT